MIIIICGLPGTGKTTLSKKIAEVFSFQYVNDWELFKNSNIFINEFENKIEVSKKHSQVIIDFIKENSNKNLVLDLEFSLSPEDFINSNIKDFVRIIYLGFISVSKEKLFDLFRNSPSNENALDEELKKQIKFYKEMSLLFCDGCQKYNLDFIDINSDRNKILNIIIEKLKKEGVLK